MKSYDPFQTDAAHVGVLNDVLDSVQKAPAPKVVVFDLDSTVFDNRPRQVHILREWGIAHGMPELFGLERTHFVDWDLMTPLVRLGIAPERAQAVHADVKQFWRERFFTSPYCLYDVAMPHAPHYVRGLHARGAHIVYLTGRHEEMRAGSAESLVRFKFPAPPEARVTLLMKPTLDIPDTDYKKSAFEAVRGIGRVIAGFDNEPAHANALKEGFPEAKIVWLKTDRSPANDVPRPDLLHAWGFAGATL
ncbi:MAG: HAD family hydrolase [Deltaproteobacteria bacterium]|nr:HAD family hydrolase [Deltaproteobacteria bacterium]